MSKIYIYPTDTVWGIGGDALKFETYERIAKVKNTSLTKPISILFSTTEQLDEFFDVDEKLLEIVNLLSDKEITFGIEKSKLKVDLPSTPFESTDYICFRLLKSSIVSGICEEVGGPFTTTSLNLTGLDPIVEYEDAHEFWKKHIDDALFVDDGKDVKLSGSSSTIVILSGGKFKYLREGRNIDSIDKVLSSFYQRND